MIKPERPVKTRIDHGWLHFVAPVYDRGTRCVNMTYHPRKKQSLTTDHRLPQLQWPHLDHAKYSFMNLKLNIMVIGCAP